MIKLDAFKHRRDLRILCLGAHSDDIEIGCGGTILRLIEEYDDIEFYWVVFSSNEARSREAKKSAVSYLDNVNKKEIVILDFKDGYFPYVGSKIKDSCEELKCNFDPDIIFTHYRNDLHQDHRLISELTWNTFRDHLILEYEILKYDGDLGAPNFFIHLTEPQIEMKIQKLLSNFSSQLDKPWFNPETLKSMSRIRGVESNSPNSYAEAFYCRKIAF